jgi:hypothetical protein
MKIRWLPILLAVLFAAPSLDAAARGKSSARATAKTSVSAKGKSASRSRSAVRGKAGGVTKAACKAGRKKGGKRGCARRYAPPPPPMVQGEGAATPVRTDTVTPRTIPSRAYAADGQSFYLNGEKIRVRGAPSAGPEGSELAKQRLQKALDSGEVTLVERALDERGNATAVVRVNGRDVADLLLLDELRGGNLP